MNDVLRTRFFVPLICFAAGAVAPVEMRAAAQGGLLNRSILSVAGEVYSSVDAASLVVASRILSLGNSVPVTTDWLQPQGFEAARGAEAGHLLDAWPEDAQRVLFVTLVWSEASRLNLFAPSQKEVVDAVARLGAGWAAAVRESKVPEPLRAQVSALAPARLTRLGEMLLRAQTFLRVRGPFAKNENLLSLGWYWHQALAVPPGTTGWHDKTDTKIFPGSSEPDSSSRIGG